MLKIKSLPIYRYSKQFYLDSLTGYLLTKEYDGIKQTVNHIYEKKLKSAIEKCNSPYLLRADDYATEELRINNHIKRYGKLITQACKASYLLGRFVAHFGNPVYSNTTTSILAYRQLYPGAIQKDHCLPRALFAASTSKSFKDNGVIFIGVFLPSRNLHAWIIEDGIQVDPFDAMWTNYQPVAVMY